MHEDEPLPGSVRPENEALLIRQDVLGTAPRPEMQRAQRRAILGLMFFLSVVGFIFILVIHSVKHRGGSSSGGGAGGGAGADADICSNSKKHRPARSCNGPSHPPPQDSMHEVDKEAEEGLFRGLDHLKPSPALTNFAVEQKLTMQLMNSCPNKALALSLSPATSSISAGDEGRRVAMSLRAKSDTKSSGTTPL